MFGDSLAFTAGWALGTEPVRAPYDIVFHSEGILGCGVMVVSDQYIHGVENAANGPCSLSSPASQQLPAVWAGLLRAQHPDVVMVMAGRWEVADQVIGGQEMHIGEPAYDAILRADLDRPLEVCPQDGVVGRLSDVHLLPTDHLVGDLPPPGHHHHHVRMLGTKQAGPHGRQLLGGRGGQAARAVGRVLHTVDVLVGYNHHAAAEDPLAVEDDVIGGTDRLGAEGPAGGEGQRVAEHGPVSYT